MRGKSERGNVTCERLSPIHLQLNKNNNQNDELYEERERLPTYDFLNEHERNGRLRKFNTRVTEKKKMK